MKNYVDANALQEYTTKLTAKFKTIFAPEITGHNIVFFGDSWTYGTGADSQAHRYATLLAGLLGMTEFNFGYGGAGFAIPSNNFLAQITYAQSHMTAAEIADTKVVLIFGGVNDIRHWSEYSLDITTYRTAIYNTVVAAKNLFPNAMIYLALSNTRMNIYTPLEFNANNFGIAAYMIPRLRLLSNMANVISGFPDFYIYEEGLGWLHPSTNGHYALAGYFQNAILGGNQDINYYCSGITLETGHSWLVNAYLYRDNYDIVCTGGQISLAEAISTKTKIGALNNPYVAPAVNQWVNMVSSDIFSGIFGITNNGNIYIQPLAAISSFIIPSFRYRFGHYE